MYMEHDGPPDTKPRGSSGYLPGGVSGEKPAPTAAEVAAAREMLHRYARNIDPPLGGQWVRTLLAALDAAEAREKAAYRDGWDANVEASREILTRAETAERERDEWKTHAAEQSDKCGRMVVRLAAVERERDAALAALKPFAIYAKSCHAMTAEEAVAWDDDGVVRKITVGDLRRAEEITKEAPRG